MTPKGLDVGGRKLWRAITTEHDLEPSQQELLLQACRMRDRCDALAPDAAAGDMAAVRQERESSLAMARLLAALRLPDAATGKRPRERRGVRGAYEPRGMSGTAQVSSLERARQRAAGG